jgi:transposase
MVAGLTARGPRSGCDRSFVDGVVWILRTGAPWRDLPPSFGKWSTVYQRFRRWAVAGRWESLRRALSAPNEPNDLLLIDSTIVKAHPHAAGARRKEGRQSDEALGRSRGGFTTKVHAVVSNCGALVRYVLTGGEASDVTQADMLVHGLVGQAVVGDRAYASNALLASIEQQGMAAVIPSRANRKTARILDAERYAQRNVIERFFGRVKVFRRVAARYDKTAASYASLLALATAVLVLGGWKP